MFCQACGEATDISMLLSVQAVEVVFMNIVNSVPLVGHPFSDSLVRGGERSLFRPSLPSFPAGHGVQSARVRSLVGSRLWRMLLPNGN